jgi:hypothetical protein
MDYMMHQLQRDGIKNIPEFTMAAAVIIAALIFAILPVESSDYPAITITGPSNGTEVPTNNRVTGNISGNLPEAYHIWLAVNPNDSEKLWWPLGGGEIVPQGTEWSQGAVIGRECGSGGEQDVGKKNVIAVLLVDENDHQYLNNWVKKSNIIQNWDGIALPPSTIVISSITVTREYDC